MFLDVRPPGIHPDYEDTEAVPSMYRLVKPLRQDRDGCWRPITIHVLDKPRHISLGVAVADRIPGVSVSSKAPASWC